jgi:hypothetical protein
MKVTRITIAVVGTLTMLLLAPFDAKASVQGVGQSSHFNGQHLAHNPPAIAIIGLWSMAVVRLLRCAARYIRLHMTFSTPETVVVAPTQPAVGCQHSEQIVKVPSVNGVMREVTILRC